MALPAPEPHASSPCLDLPDLEGASAQEVLAWVYAEHRRVALVASFQAESGVLIDMACDIVASPEVVTVDTLRLPTETFTAMDELRRRYPIRLHVVRPDPGEVERMIGEHGRDLFRRSVDLRYQCCDVRKIRPLAAALRGYDAWITGLRREQSLAREHTPVVSSDDVMGGITKVAPLTAWSRDDVQAYSRARAIPQHPLHERGYTSIGCEPCTRATLPGEPDRAGRWWWEPNGNKECGLHSIAITAV